MTDLEPLSPREGVRLYLDHRETDLAEKSLQNQTYRLNSFFEWCIAEDIDNLNELTGRDLHRFRIARSKGEIPEYGPVNKITLNGILSTLKKALEYWAAIDAVEPGMRERVLLPDIDDSEAARDELLEAEDAAAILEYLNRFQYASRDHLIVALLWHTGMRLGTLRALDVDDVDLEEGCLDLWHRPESETPLKNGEAAERSIAIGSHYGDVLRAYIEHHRHDVEDEYGRQPLITSKQGRLSSTPIRLTCY
jgi:site-specific recombinase XerD